MVAMDLAAIPREFPQFGKSIWNVSRDRGSVFGDQSGDGEGGCAHSCGGSCGEECGGQCGGSCANETGGSTRVKGQMRSYAGGEGSGRKGTNGSSAPSDVLASLHPNAVKPHDVLSAPIAALV
jgi:hypothetical protein